MRSPLVALLALVAAGAAAWLLLRGPEPSDPMDASPPNVVRDGGGAPDDGGIVAVAPRQGVMSPRDRDLVADPDAPEWHTNTLAFPTSAVGQRMTGRVLLEAVAQHLYVRAQDLDTLDALRRQDLEIEVPSEMPMSAVAPLLERAGYHVQVQPPRFVFRRMPEAQR
jgi:hypothetical protein